MAKAIYTTTNIGHYGLGFEYYTHFTLAYPTLSGYDGAPSPCSASLAGGRSVNPQKLE